MDDVGDFGFPGKEATPGLELKDQVNVVLKEYDSLRKQIDQGSGFMQGLVSPLSVAFAGAMIGWHGDIPPQIAVMAVPVLIMGALAAAMHGEAYTEYSGLLLAGVENRVFELTGSALLRHETTFAIKRQKASGRKWLLAVSLISAAYVGCEMGLYFLLNVDCVVRDPWKLPAGMGIVAIAAVSGPIIYGFVMAIRFKWTRDRWNPSRLAKYLESSAGLRQDNYSR